ncbi:MAG TPA: thiol reductant ABC exporter subunit CydD [Jiangellaceae bacterium]|nr:thiol reductant ABC exporter subunit CydD [Jiangellaceae bacterium]
MRAVDPRLLHRARASLAYLGVCVAIGVVTALLVVAQASLLAHGIAAAFVGGADLADLGSTMLLLALVIVGRALTAWATEGAAHRASAQVKSQLRSQLLAHAVRLGPRWLAGRRSAELATLATRGVDALDVYFSRYLPQLVLAVVVPIVVLLRMVPADLLAAVTVALTLPLIPVFTVLIGMAAQARSRRRWRALTHLSHHFLDVVAGLPTLKIFGRAKVQAAQIRRVTDEYRRETMATLRIAFMSSLVLELMASLAVALVAVGVGLRLVEGTLDLETGLLVLILAPEAYLPLRHLGTHYHASAEGLAAAEEVFSVLESPVPPTGRLTDIPDLRHAELRVEGLTVRHTGRTESAPDSLDVALRPGELVALAGPSGTGKTTLLHVLLGLVRPDEGRVVVVAHGQEVDLAELDPETWRRNVSWVAQQPYVVPGSLADNVRLGAPSATDDAVVEALRNAGLGDLALDTWVGERGAGLSLGQRRRMALARALVRTTPVLLLDEPTASLDTATEEAVLATVRSEAANGRMVLVVAHRPSVLAAADRVVQLAPAAVAA